MLKGLRLLLPLLLALFLLISNISSTALKLSVNYVSDSSAVKAPSVTLHEGNKGAVVISSTHDYATVTTTAGFTFYENASAATQQGKFNPTSMQLVGGRNLSGNISDLATVNYHSVAFYETSGTQFSFYFNFTEVPSSTGFNYNMYDQYHGNTGHELSIQFYNFTSNSWMICEQYSDETAFTWHNGTVTSTNGLIQNGTIMGKLVHESPGNHLHYEEIDYIAVTTTNAQLNTGFSVPTSSGSFSVVAGASVSLQSPTFSKPTTVYSGSYLLDLWASATVSGNMWVSFRVIDSSNNAVATIASGNTGSIGTVKSEVKTAFAGSQITIPAGGHLIANITNPTGSGTTFTIYWGAGQSTNYQTPADYDYIIAIVNSASASAYLSLSTYNASALNRLTNVTITSYSPSTNQVVITNGVITQSAGPTMAIAASSTLYLKVHTVANAFGSSNIVLLMKFSSGSKPFAYEFINLTVN